MEKDTTIIVTNFRNASSQLFATLFADFMTAAQKLDRHTNENVFQQLLGGYIHELEKRLRRTAEKMMNQYSGQTAISLLHMELTKQISFYVSQFRLKARAL